MQAGARVNTEIRIADFLTLRWAVVAAGLAVGGGVGLYEMYVGHLLATNQVVVWTTPLISYIFLALASSGISILVAYGLLRDDRVVVERTRYLLVLDLALLLGGFTALATELGSIPNMIYILLSPNPSSPIWWMGNFYSIKLILVGVKLYRDVDGRHGGLDRPLAWATLAIAAAATLTLGAVFGTAIARPDFAGAFASLLMLALALTSGFAWLVVLRRDGALADHVGGLARQLSGALAAILLLKYVYDAHATTEGLLRWVDPSMPVLFALAALVGGVVPRIAATVTLVACFWTLYGFVIAGQRWVFGANTSFFGEVVTFTPNLAEAATLVLGLSVAAALYNLGKLVLLQPGPGDAPDTP